MQKYQFDLFVIGAGSGGVRAARISAAHGARVAIAEESRFGGTCVIRGCVPKKLLMYASQLGRYIGEAAGFGWSITEVTHDWDAMIAAKDLEVARLEQVYERLLNAAGVTSFATRAKILGPHSVEVDGRSISARVILIATGAHAVKPGISGASVMITSDDVFALQARPQRVAIIGGGYIACEFAGIFNGLGSQVVQLHRGTQVLRGFDEELRGQLGAEIARSGVDLRLDTEVRSICRRDGAVQLQLTNGEVLEVNAAMAAIGRHPNTADLGLECAAVALTERGAVKVDSFSMTTCPSIYAVGDVTDRLNLTPVAIHEGHAFADTVFGSTPRTTFYEHVPFAVFSQPQAASVGLSEQQARARFGAVSIYASTFRPMRTVMSRRDETVLVKLVVDTGSQKILGAHIVGADAAEIIQGMAVAITAGATKADFDATIAVHPTLAEEFVTLRAPR
jgi:glutathione reductase (NADPH)